MFWYEIDRGLYGCAADPNFTLLVIVMGINWENDEIMTDWFGYHRGAYLAGGPKLNAVKEQMSHHGWL